MNDPYPSLHQTVRVGMDPERMPLWGGIGVPVGIEHGIAVPHEGINVPCGQDIGTRIDFETGTEWNLYCRKRVGHAVPKGQEPHVPVDRRLVAAPYRVTHTERFKPNLIPGGVDQNAVPIPHDCANHLPDTKEVLRRGW